jgi:hypothetical protein
MTPNRFDELSCEFANGVSRRSVLKTLAWSGVGGIFGSIPILGSRLAWAGQSQSCATATVAACIAAANATFEQETQDCQEVGTPQTRGRCIAAAKKRHDEAVKACDQCPTGTRCESNVCCPNSQLTCAPPCNVTKTGDSSTLQSTVTSTIQGQSLVLTTTSTLPSPITRSATGVRTFKPIAGLSVPTTGTTAITLGQNPLLEIDYSSGNGSLRTQVSYGAAFQGIKLAVFTGDGNLIQGTIDGRTVAPFPPGTDMSQVKFTDGNPPPRVTVDPAIQQAINDILAKGQSATSNCLKTQTARPKPNFDSPACDDCTQRCGDKYWTCFGFVTGGCIAALWFEAPCEAIGLAKCQTDYDACIRDCDAPGEVCCPVQCNGGCCDEGTTCCPNALHGLACCGSGAKCASENTENGICCPQNSGPNCANHCCASGEICVDPPRGICCPAGSRLCGDTCCPMDAPCFDNRVCCHKGDEFCHGGCCPPGNCINDFCCAPPDNRLCGGVCCGSLFPCCNNVCCGPNDLCMDNRACCSRDQICGHICCPAGQRCQNAATQTCAACPAGTAPCASHLPNGVPVTTCCPTGGDCCGGQCCTNQTGHECTGPGGTCGTIH